MAVDARQPAPATVPARAPEPHLRPAPPPPDERARRNRQFFDGYWQRGRHERDQLWREWWHDGYEQLLAWAGPLAGKRVLHLFAGLGEDANLLATHGADVVALDFSLAALQRVARAPVAPARLRVLCANATSLPIASASIDVVIAINGLCHTPKATVLAECKRVLRPGGKVLLLEVLRHPHLAMLARFLEPYKWHAPHRFLSVGELEVLARDFSYARHREFFVLSVLSAMLLRLPLGPKIFRPLHRLLIAADRVLLHWLPWLRRVSYLTVAELRP